jgi:hypothetical protein
MAVMGDIYSKSGKVAVLLPKEDKEAYEILKEFGDIASYIKVRAQLFDLE